MTTRYFVPGTNNQKLSSQKLTSQYAYNNPNCFCQPPIIQKGVYEQNYPNISNNIRVSSILKIKNTGTRQGNVIYGDALFGENKSINYIGKVFGQPGGSGQPIRNNF
jgi:hypothetical protein